MVTIQDLPDEVLTIILRKLDTPKVKSLLMVQGLQSSINRYMYENYKYVLQYDTKGKTYGLKLSQVRKYQRHVGRFRHLEINICLREGEEFSKLLDQYSEIWNQTPTGVRGMVGKSRRNIHLIIHFFYKASTFNSIKDELLLIREISSHFNSPINTVKVDLVLRRDES